MKKINNNEKGIVSILVSMVMMIVLTLLVLGLAQIGVSDQQNALKRQLSTEAYYLAESGINNAINKGISNGTSLCNSITLDSLSNSTIPCVITTSSGISGNLTTSLYQLNNGQSKVIPIDANLNNINDFTLNWGGTSGVNTGCSNSSTNFTLKSVANWNCPFPLLMVNLASADLFKTNALISDLFKEGASNGIVTLYLYPTTDKSTNVNPTIASNGASQIIPVYCNTVTNKCNLKLNMTNMKHSTKYYLRITAIYGSTAITLSANQLISGVTSAIYSNQASIDSTGKVGTTAQRLYTRINTDTTITNLPNQGLIDQTPLFAIQTTNDLCKNFQGYYNSSSDYVFNTDSKTGPNNSSACL